MACDGMGAHVIDSHVVVNGFTGVPDKFCDAAGVCAVPPK